MGMNVRNVGCLHLAMGMAFGDRTRPLKICVSAGEVYLSTSSNSTVEMSTRESLRVWRDFSTDDRIMLRETFKRAIARSDFGSEVIFNLLKGNDKLCNRLLGVTHMPTSIAVLRREYPRAAQIGDGVQRFLSEITADLNNPIITPGVIIKKCRVLGAHHKRWRVDFEADSWMHVKSALLVTIVSGFPIKSSTDSNCIELHKFCAKLPFSQSRKQDKIRAIWLEFIDVVVRNMKSGFMDSVCHGYEAVENEDVVADQPSTSST
uniref:GLOBIN domain-containing protein n=1 Tax=Panagrellus redivivus TaxID=6233 RepID=A0A7E4ZZ64_PANRE